MLHFWLAVPTPPKLHRLFEAWNDVATKGRCNVSTNVRRQ